MNTERLDMVTEKKAAGKMPRPHSLGLRINVVTVCGILIASIGLPTLLYLSAALLEHMRSAVGEFVGRAQQFDDLTQLCLRYEGPPHKTQDAEEA